MITASAMRSLRITGLLLASGMSLLVLAAEAATGVPPVPLQPAGSPSAGTAVGSTDSPPRATGDEAARRTIEQTLDREFTCEFKDLPLDQVVAKLRAATGLSILLDPYIVLEAEPEKMQPQEHVSFTADKMTLRAVLDRITEPGGLDWRVHGRHLLIIQGRPVGGARPQGACVHLRGASPALRERLAKRVTLDFQDASFPNIIDALRQALGSDIIVAPELAGYRTSLSMGGGNTVVLSAELDDVGDFLDVCFTAQGDTLIVRRAEDTLPSWRDFWSAVKPFNTLPGD